MKAHMTNGLNLGKCTPIELGFLKSLGWKIIDPWYVSGDEAVETISHDRYSQQIIDKRFQPKIKEKEYLDFYQQ